MDLTTATPITHSNPSLPAPPQNPYGHRPPLPLPLPLPLPNPNLNHLHLTSEPYTYYYPPTQIQPQPQPQYYHYQQRQEPVTDADPASSYYQQDPNWQHYYSQINAIHHLPNPNLPATGVAVPSNWVEQYAAVATPNATTALPSQAIQSHGIGNGKRKKISKKTKVVQSASCDICKVVCTSKDVLEQHKLGKKHLKTVSKMANFDNSLAATSNAENLAKTKAGASWKSKRPASYQGDLETKRMKVVAEGASVAAVRVCAACNVVCNSETVFNYHIAGQKHAASMNKYLASTVG